ncbi:MAG: DNA repair protein RadA [Gammaproteobacteria bacterium]
MTGQARPSFQCQACGAPAPKWAGQCGDCGAWNTLTESAAPLRVDGRPRGLGYSGEAAPVVGLAEVEVRDEVRTSSGTRELDRVLGGGLVKGAVVLLGGDPGIGKSTLLLQSLAAGGETRGLYVSGEESAQQVALRAHRLGKVGRDLRLLTETRVERVLAAAENEAPRVLVIDSIQTLYSESLAGAPGTVSQLRESASRLVRYAKRTGTTVFLVGHVTKEGVLAGPRVLEHMVDTVLYFEGDEGSRYRIVRAVKNRYGAVHELGVFVMTESGLREVPNPSSIFLQRHAQGVPGSAVMVTREGTRPLLIEVQALLDESHLANPRRVAVGLDPNRLAMLLAVLHRHAGVVSYDQDVFVNIVGGVRVNETGADLAVALAVVSSLRNRPLPEGTVVFGEIGLSGEVRPVPHGPERLREAVKHGFARALIPRANAPRGDVKGLEVTAIERVAEALAASG